MCLVFALILLDLEFVEYLEVDVENELVVDSNRDDPLQIYFNITFPKLPCGCTSILLSSN